MIAKARGIGETRLGTVKWSQHSLEICQKAGIKEFAIFKKFVIVIDWTLCLMRHATEHNASFSKAAMST